MRGKKAKALRRIAEEQTVGQPAVAYKHGSPPEYHKDPRTSVPTVLSPCTRRWYQRLKWAEVTFG